MKLSLVLLSVAASALADIAHPHIKRDHNAHAAALHTKDVSSEQMGKRDEADQRDHERGKRNQPPDFVRDGPRTVRDRSHDKQAVRKDRAGVEPVVCAWQSAMVCGDAIQETVGDIAKLYGIG